MGVIPTAYNYGKSHKCLGENATAGGTDSMSAHATDKSTVKTKSKAPVLVLTDIVFLFLKLHH